MTTLKTVSRGSFDECFSTKPAQDGALKLLIPKFRLFDRLSDVAIGMQNCGLVPKAEVEE